MKENFKTATLLRYQDYAPIRPILIKYFICLFITVTSWLSQESAAQTQVPRFEPSTEVPVKIGKEQKFTFGYLVVPEDHAKPQGKIIKLPVFILKSRSSNPEPDPVIYTAGGPGSSSLGIVPYSQYYKYLDNRDFIVFEQRGTRYAQPCLDCPELNQAKINLLGKETNELEKIAAQVEAARQCRSKLTAEGINLNAYTTKQSAADLEDLRRVLGIKQWNLLTVSYSTKIAQTLMRDYPTGLRSVVMDSPLPLAVNYDDESVANFTQSLDLLFKNCESDSACREAFPRLSSRFQQVIARANETPVPVIVKHPTDQRNITLLLTGNDLVRFIQLGSTSQLSRLPYLINRICAARYEVLQPIIEQTFSQDNRALGMRLSVWCSEELPFNSRQNSSSRKALSSGIKNNTFSVFPEEVCREWKVTKAKAVENKAIKSNIPALIISGEYDPDTPTHWAKQLSKQLVNSYYLEFKGMSHTPSQNWDNNCAMDVAQAFFENPRQTPAAACYSNLKQVTFKTKDFK